MGGEERKRGPQSPFVGWILINSTRVLAIKLCASTREDLLCEVEKLKREKKLQGDKVAVGFNIIFHVWEADQPTADATADTTTRFFFVQKSLLR